MPTALYLHEVVDIVGDGAVPYMEHALGFHAERAADRGLRLFGTWQVVGATGRWPQVVNVWELLDGWDGWGRLVRSTNLRRTENEELARWWREASRYRSGGVDRLLGGAPGCPTLDELVEAGVTGEVFVHELSEVWPGAGPDYLAAVVEGHVPVMAEHGHQLIGAYEVLLRDTEVVTLWATDLDSHLTLMQAAETDERIPKWREEVRQYLSRWREELMVPHQGTPLATVVSNDRAAEHARPRGESGTPSP